MKTETLQLVTKIEYKGDITTLIDMEKYSTLNKLYSITAFVYRFLCNLKSRANRYKENVIKKVVGKARLPYDELVTVICEIENLINSRPLTYLTEENYQTPLSPYHLLYGWNINDRNEPLTNIETNQTSAIVRVKHLQTVLEDLKKKFMLNIYLVCVKNILMLKIKHRASVI